MPTPARPTQAGPIPATPTRASRLGRWAALGAVAAVAIAATTALALTSASRPSKLVNVTEELGAEPGVCRAVQEPSLRLVAARQPQLPRPKQTCRGKFTDYVLDFDATNVMVTIKAEPQFKDCELKLSITPAKPAHEDKGGGQIVFPYGKDPIKITIEGRFVCKKEGGGTLIVPIDTLSVTFQPPDTFIFPLK